MTKAGTLLEFALEQELGEPLRRRGSGESEWPCPHCSHPRFHTFPIHPKFRHRAKCWSCGFRGDIHDMLKDFYPDECYGDRPKGV